MDEKEAEMSLRCAIVVNKFGLDFLFKKKIIKTAIALSEDPESLPDVLPDDSIKYRSCLKSFAIESITKITQVLKNAGEDERSPIRKKILETMTPIPGKDDIFPNDPTLNPREWVNLQKFMREQTETGKLISLAYINYFMMCQEKGIKSNMKRQIS